MIIVIYTFVSTHDVITSEAVDKYSSQFKTNQSCNSRMSRHQIYRHTETKHSGNILLINQSEQIALNIHVNVAL